MLPNQIFILGGGASIRYLGAIDKGLFNFLSDKFCIGINYSYKFCKTTCSLGVDETLYNDTARHDEISKLDLWIGKDTNTLLKRELNSIFFKPSRNYNRDLKNGVYRHSLSGIFAVSLAIRLLSLGQKAPELYLLGYDYGPWIKDGKVACDANGKPLTHWYQDEFTHRGTGKISWYNQTGLDKETRKRTTNAELEFKPFANESIVKIYNVCPVSNIPTFKKIDYDEMFSKQFESVKNQKKLAKEIKDILWQVKTEMNI